MKRRIIEVLILVLVFIAGMWFYHIWQSRNTTALSKKERKILYWVAPMNPNYRSDKPGKSPMGMDLVPVYEDEDNAEDDIVKISPAVINNLGVETAKVERRNLARIINTVGYVMVDENNIEHVHTYIDGWVKELMIKTTGEEVLKNQLLMTLYSPTLNNAQEELLLALKTNNKTLIGAGKKKLITLGMDQSQIDRLITTRKLMEKVNVYTNQSGIVSHLNVREGQYVKPDTELIGIEDLSQIWVIAEVFEYQSAWVKEGQSAIATLSYLPGKTWQGKVDYVYPRLDPKTHTLRVRLTFPNPDLTFKPNMYANVKIISKTIPDALAISKLALISTGEGDSVILALGKGRFKAQPVKVGIESEQYYQILSGLNNGQQIVTSGQFLIDSESNIKAAMSRLADKTTIASTTTTMKNQSEHIGMGVLKAVDHKNHSVTIYHQPIPSLGMDNMDMILPVAESVSLKSAKPGDKIHFIIVKQKDNYMVNKIHILDNETLDKKDKQ